MKKKWDFLLPAAPHEYDPELLPLESKKDPWWVPYVPQMPDFSFEKVYESTKNLILQQREHKKLLLMTAPNSILMDFSIITCRTGRRTGKTTNIARLVQEFPNTFVVCLYHRQKKQLSQLGIPADKIFPLCRLEELTEALKTHKTDLILVDTSECLSKEQQNKLEQACLGLSSNLNFVLAYL